MKTKLKKINNVPNLRFPGFEGEWEEKSLEEVTEKINSGKTPLGGESAYSNEGIIFIRSQNVTNNKLELKNAVFISEEINRGMKNSIVKANDILLNITGASLGRSCVVPEDFNIGNVNQHVCIIRTSPKYTPRFIQPILSSDKGQNMFKSVQVGGGREGLNFENIKKIKINCPFLPEQEKIADFLSLIDKRIETQNKIIEALKTLSKGMSNSLFTQKIRFKDKDSIEFSDWKVENLKTIGHVYTGLSDKNKEDFGIGKPYIQYKQIFDSSKIKLEENALVKISVNEHQNKVRFGDIFFTASSETREEIGMSSVLLREVEEVYLNSFCFGFRPNSIMGLRPQYAQFFFRSKSFRNEIVKLAQGSTRYNLSKAEFLKILILLPSYEEQESLASFLATIEQKIEVNKNLLVHHHRLKNNLLKQLFT